MIKHLRLLVIGNIPVYWWKACPVLLEVSKLTIYIVSS